MKKRFHRQRRFYTAMLLGLLCVLVWSHGQGAAISPAHEQLHAAWRQASAIGQVTYRTVTVQTIKPTERLENVGRRARTGRLEVEGTLDRPANAMTLQMRSGAADSSQWLDLKVEDGLAFGRAHESEAWQPLDGLTDFFAPGGDPLGFLAAATHIRRVEGQESGLLGDGLLPAAYTARLTRYAFDLDGPAYAVYMRQQMEEGLRQRGELPAHLHLDLNRAYVAMQGQGEIWLGEEGLPVRQIVYLAFPPKRGDAEWVSAQITTEFSEWGNGKRALDSGYWILGIGHASPLGVFSAHAEQLSVGLGVFLFFAGVVALGYTHRRSRALYAMIMLAVVVSMLGGPLVQAAQTVDFIDRQTKQSAASSGQSAAIDAKSEYATRTTHDENHQSSIVNLQSTSLACTDASDTLDSDGDGLSDAVECTELGTYPDTADTDSDGISDGAEVTGYPRNKPAWFLNPRNPDGNGDGVIDGIECPGLADIDESSVDTAFVYSACVDTDRDGSADVWDYDNDGDGVPDRVDGAPFAYFGERTGVTDGELAFNLTFTDTTGTKPVFVDFQIRPPDESHLWYSNTVLDWPSGDTQGQVQRINNSTFADLGHSGSTADKGDLIMVPTLEFEIHYDSNNPAAGLPISGTFANTSADIPDYGDLAWLDTDLLDDYGIVANRGENDQALLLWLPLSLLQDDVGDTPVGWQTRMVYFPRASTLGNNQQVRLIWLINAIIDSCDTSGMGADDEYGDWCATDSGHWSSSTSIIQTYYEDFFVTGLTVTEDHGGELSLVAEKPGVGNTRYEEALWHAAAQLQDSYLHGERNGDNSRMTPSDLSGYLPTANLHVQTMRLAQTADLATVASVTSTAVLNTVFSGNVSVGDRVNLLYVGEFSGRSVTLGQDAVHTSGGVLHPSLVESTLDTTGVVRWSPYEYQGSNVWDEADIEEYMGAFESDLVAGLTTRALTVALGGIAPADEETVRAGIVALGWSYYLSLYLGTSALLAIDDTSASTDRLDASRFVYTPSSDDDAIAAIAHSLLEDMLSFYARNIYAVTANGQSVTVGGAAWEALGGSIEAIATALGQANNGISSSSTEALAAVADYYKLGRVDSDDLTAPVAISLVADTYENVAVGVTLGTAKTAWGLFSAVWGYQVASDLLVFANKLSALRSQTGLVAKAKLAWNNVALWAVAALILSVGLALYSFFAASYDNDLQRSNAEAYLIAQIIYALIIFMITLIPGVGFLITGILGLLDGIMIAICSAVGTDADSETNRWWCGGVSQAITLALYYAIYDFTLLPRLDRSDRLDIEMDSPSYAQNERDPGFIVGNDITFRGTVTTSLYFNEPNSLGHIYLYQFSDANLRDSTFAYRFQKSKDDFSVGLNESAWQVPAGREDDSRKGERFYQVSQVSDDFPMGTAGINVESSPLYLSEAYAFKAQKCWSVPVPVCGLETYKDNYHLDLGMDFVFDVYPTTVAEFMAMSEMGNDSYRLAWDSSFPTLVDGDGDGLRSRAAGGVDPNDSRGDTDLDGLSDYWEYANGYDLEDSDPDEDGLTDYWEAFYGTEPFRADSDGDGLGDAEEIFHPNIGYPFENSVYTDTDPPPHASSQAAWIGGWDVVYDWNQGVALSTWVSSDPNDADSDDDLILDSRERIYGYHPWVAGTTNLLSMRSSLQTHGNSLPYVAAGGTLTYTAVIANELENRYATGLLQAEFPTDAVLKTSVIDTIAPQQTVAINGNLTVDLNASGATSMTVRAGVEFEDATDRVLWLRMNEDAGATTFSDSTFRDHSATCSGSNCPVANGSYLTFTGSDNVTLPESDDFDLASFSVGAWMNTSNATNSSTLFNHADDLRLWLSSGQVRVTHESATHTAGSGSAVASQWTHVMVTYDATTATGTLYVGGVSKTTYSASPLVRGGSGITLGGLLGGTLLLDEVEIHNRALSATEVQNLVNADPVLQAQFRSGGSRDLSVWNNSVQCSGDRCPSIDDASGRATFDQTEYLTASGNSLNLSGDNFTFATWLRPQTRGVPFDDYAARDSTTSDQEDNFAAYLPTRNISYRGLTLDWQGIAGNNNSNNGSNQYPTMLVAQDGRVHISFSSASGSCAYTSGSGMVRYDKWQHLTISFDGSGFDFYVNGELAHSSGSVCSGKKLPALNSLYIGRPNDHGYLYGYFLNHTKAYDGTYWDWGCGIGGCQKIDRKDENKLEMESTQVWSASTEDEKIYYIQSGRIIDDSNTRFYLYEQDDGEKRSRINELVNNTTLRKMAGDYYGWEFDGNNGTCDANVSCGQLFWSLSNQFFQGQLDDFRVYDYGLNAGQVENLYESTFATLHFSFDEPPGRSVLADESGNGLDLGCVEIAHTCPDYGGPLCQDSKRGKR